MYAIQPGIFFRLHISLHRLQLLIYVQLFYYIRYHWKPWFWQMKKDEPKLFFCLTFMDGKKCLNHTWHKYLKNKQLIQQYLCNCITLNVTCLQYWMVDNLKLVFSHIPWRPMPPHKGSHLSSPLNNWISFRIWIKPVCYLHKLSGLKPPWSVKKLNKLFWIALLGPIGR